MGMHLIYKQDWDELSIPQVSQPGDRAGWGNQAELLKMKQ
jgi:hypothetical protein